MTIVGRERLISPSLMVGKEKKAKKSKLNPRFIQQINELNEVFKDETNPLGQQQRQLMHAKLNAKKYDKLNLLVQHKSIQSHRFQELDDRQKKLKQSFMNQSSDTKQSYHIKNYKKNNINKEQIERQLFPELYGHEVQRPSYFEVTPQSQTEKFHKDAN